MRYSSFGYLIKEGFVVYTNIGKVYEHKPNNLKIYSQKDICDNLGLLYKGGILFESDIDSLKTNMFKVQVCLKEDFDKDTFKDLDVLSYKKIGSVATLIILIFMSSLFSKNLKIDSVL